MSLQESITPTELAKPAVTISVDTIIFRFGAEDQYAFASISFQDEHGTIVSNQTVQFTEQELAGWGADDTELVAAVKAKLNLP